MTAAINRWYNRPLVGYLLVVLIAVLPLFGHLDDLPIQFFDEQRLVTNSMELNASGNLIVTTYEGLPDYSNTKPPLMIWLQALSLRLFGNNELGARIPSALAALATCLLIYSFCARKLHSGLLGLISVTVLCTASGYITLHGTRTGDYDALLTLFTTAYCLSYFSYLEEDKTRQLYGTFVFLLLAVMTKCVAACFMLPALLIYTLWRRKLISVLTTKHFYIGSIILVLPVSAYYLYRQHLDPGYFAAVAQMDLGGRYLHALSYANGPLYYVECLLNDWMVPWFFVGIAGLVAGMLSKDQRLRRITVFLALVTTVYLAVLSFSVTKFYWYALPVYPLLAIATGILLCTLAKSIQALWSPGKKGLLAASAFVVAVLIWPYSEALERSLNPQTPVSNMENGMMGFFMKDVLHGNRNIDGQYVAIESYQGNIRWYFKALKEKGQIVHTIEDRDFKSGQTVIAYQEEVKNYINEHFDTNILEDFRGVVVYKIIRPKA